LTLKEFNDALAKGQGRAVLHLRSVDPAPYFHSVRRAVLRWQGYDAQFEPKRGEYLVDLIDASSEPDQLEKLAIHHLARQKGYWGHRAQKRDIVRVLAMQGSTEARLALYSTFESGDHSAGDAIIDVDGLAGLEWLLVHSVDIVEVELWERDVWVYSLADRLGEEAVRTYLLASSLSVVREAAEYFERQFRNRPDTPPSKLSPASFCDLKRQWLEKKTWVSFRKWGMEASLSELSKAALEFETSTEVKFLRALATIFHKVEKYPGSYRAVVQRARAWSTDDLPNPFSRMLGERKIASARSLGLSFLDRGRVSEAIELLRLNASPEDGPAILQGLGGVALNDPWFVHGIVLDCLDLAKVLDDLHAAWILGWIYEYSPCSTCRSSAFRHMTNRGLATPAMVAEAVWDCDPDTRQVARSVVLVDPPPSS
jgi:hypothetical protein